jgi:hypothetical protein
VTSREFAPRASHTNHFPFIFHLRLDQNAKNAAKSSVFGFYCKLALHHDCRLGRKLSAGRCAVGVPDLADFVNFAGSITIENKELACFQYPCLVRLPHASATSDFLGRSYKKESRQKVAIATLHPFMLQLAGGTGDNRTRDYIPV